jgi:hypothetical protein
LEAEYLLLEEYHDWVELHGIEITQRWNRTSEETERDTVIEKCWVRTFLHVLYLSLHLLNV